MDITLPLHRPALRLMKIWRNGVQESISAYLSQLFPAEAEIWNGPHVVELDNFDLGVTPILRDGGRSVWGWGCGDLKEKTFKLISIGLKNHNLQIIFLLTLPRAPRQGWIFFHRIVNFTPMILSLTKLFPTLIDQTSFVLLSFFSRSCQGNVLKRFTFVSP